jgi:hypothetical protein
VVHYFCFAVPSWFSSFVFSLALLATLAVKLTPVPFSGRWEPQKALPAWRFDMLE